MAAVVRLKRRFDEEPLEAVVLACKRKKTEIDLETTKNETPFQTIFKFAGTVKNQEEDVASHIDKILRKDKRILGLRLKPDVIGKVRTEIQHLAKENRLKVVNCFRDLKDSNVLESEKETEVTGEGGNKPFTIFDVVSHISDGQESNLSSQSQTELDPGDDSSGPEAGYVYDLYYTSVAETNELADLDSLSIHPFSQSDWEYLDPEDSSDMLHEEEDEDDSNDENNWRNDYPDSDNSVDEDDIRMAMQMGDLNLGEGKDRSSDDAGDGEDSSDDLYEDFVYEVRVDPQDVAMYGEGYANYKARMNYLLYDNEYHEEAYDQEHSSDEEEDPAERFT